MNRLDPTQLKNRLKQAGVWSKKQFGQHFLIDRDVLDVMLAQSAVQPGERVLEIGPGPGVLTERLLEVGADLLTFEADPEMAKILREDFPSIQLTEGDALKTVPEKVDATPYKVVANIPYQITTPLLRLFLEGEVAYPPLSMTLLIQKEVAERLAANARKPGRGYLSVLAQYYAEVQVVKQVPAASFWPAPEVDSAVIHMVVKTERPLPVEEEHSFFTYVKSAFIEPRKQLKNVLAGMRGLESEVVVRQLVQLGLSENIRAQELTEEQWLALYNANV